MSSDFKYSFCYVVEEIFELGNTTKSRCLRVCVEAQENGKEPWINQATVNALIGNKHYPTIRLFLFDYQSRRPNSSEHNPNTGHSTYLHDSILATAAKKQ